MFYKRLFFNDEDLITQTLKKELISYTQINHLHTETIDHERLNCVPKLLEQLKNYDLKLLIARIFITPANSYLPIHRDGNSTYPKFVALNWPLFNCEQSTMYWYNLKNKNTPSNITNDPRYASDKYIYMYTAKDCNMVDQLKFTNPHLVDINSLHNVVNSSDKSRVILSLRFESDPFHLFPKPDSNDLQGPY